MSHGCRRYQYWVGAALLGGIATGLFLVTAPNVSQAQPHVLLAQPVTVHLNQDGHALTVDTLLNGSKKARLILDTGATYSSISREMAVSLGYNLAHAEKIVLTTANGTTEVPKITLKTVTLDGFTAHNVEATVMTLPKELPFSGILGLNFVKEHRITIDVQAEQLSINARD